MKKLVPFLFLFSPCFAADQATIVEVPPPQEIAAGESVSTDKNFVADIDKGPENEDEVDTRVLRDFIENRGLIATRQTCGSLTIAGDVRARWIATGEKVHGEKKRGMGTGVGINVFKSEFNLFMDYVDPKSWVSTKVRYSAIMGLEGSLTKINLDRAFIGYDIYENDYVDFYIELGRSKLDYIFDSRVQFSSNFDGIHLFYTNDWACVGEFVIHGGPFIVDAVYNHYAWAVETFIDDFVDTGIVFKYSLIDWYRHAPTLNFGNLDDSGDRLLIDNPRYRFLISQMLIGWVGDVDFCQCKTLYIYSAVLTNHLARKNKTTHYTYANKAFYVGFTLGKLCQATDWSLDMNFQYVQAQAIPEFDLSGIGHGNADGDFLSDAIATGLVGDAALGFTNYQGLQTSLLYALTDTLSLRVKAEFSVPIDRKIGGSFFYKGFEMSAIYAF